jgi:hypothetical protein
MLSVAQPGPEMCVCVCVCNLTNAQPHIANPYYLHFYVLIYITTGIQTKISWASICLRGKVRPLDIVLRCKRKTNNETSPVVRHVLIKEEIERLLSVFRHRGRFA